MQVRMRTHITGYRDGVEWPPAGGLVDVEEQEAERLFTAGLADPVEAPAADPLSDVPAGSVEDILEWVGDNPERASAALAAEQGGKARKGLLGPLEDLVAG